MPPSPEQHEARKAQAEQVTPYDEATLYNMRAELAHDLTALFHGDDDDQAEANLKEWLESIQPPETIAKEAATAAAAVLLAFERGYRMSQEQDRDAT